jgi:hypothetical protein
LPIVTRTPCLWFPWSVISELSFLVVPPLPFYSRCSWMGVAFLLLRACIYSKPVWTHCLHFWDIPCGYGRPHTIYILGIACNLPKRAQISGIYNIVSDLFVPYMPPP